MPIKSRQIGRKKQLAKVCNHCQPHYEAAAEILADLNWTMIFDGMSKIIKSNGQALRQRAKAHLTLVGEISQGKSVEVERLQNLLRDLQALYVLAETRVGVINNELIILSGRTPKKRTLHNIRLKKIRRMLRRAEIVRSDISRVLAALQPRPLLLIISGDELSEMFTPEAGVNGHARRTPDFSQN